MNGQWDRVDADWAWQPYVPTAEVPWDVRHAAHLLRRAGFGGSWQQVQEAVRKSPQEVLDDLFRPPAKLADFDRESESLAQSVLATGDSKQLAAWWLHRMVFSPAPLIEKMTLFWHGHFATSAEKVNDAELMYLQNQLFRRNALGNFAQLVQEVSKDPAMLIYLDSATNRKGHPNENYARELMELFTLGEGNYTERDVQQLARCFTGWEIRRKRFRFNPYQFDEGEKILFDKRGTFTGEQAVEIVLERPQMPTFIVRKLFQFFVCDEPAPPDVLLEPLARRFRETGFNVHDLVRHILGSQLFFSPLAIGKKVRSPVDLVVGLLRNLEGTANLFLLAQACEKMGQALFFPPNVKGWDGGRRWINSATLVARANFVHALLNDSNTRFARGSLLDLARHYHQDTAQAFVDWLVQLLLAVPLPNNVIEELVALASRATTEENYRDVVLSLSTIPEFQLV